MGSITILSPRGAIAQDDVEAFARAVEDQRNRTNGRLVLDFSQVSFLDSRGIESLWDFADRQREAGHTVRIAAVPELCREILELTDIAGQLDLFDSTESAVRSFL
jgi:anti-anti-sigma factor